MSNNEPYANDQKYQEFARRMHLFEDGPMTTQFEQLVGIGIPLPAPESLDDSQAALPYGM